MQLPKWMCTLLLHAEAGRSRQWIRQVKQADDADDASQYSRAAPLHQLAIEGSRSFCELQ